MAKRITGSLEYAMCCKQAQDAAQGIGIDADSGGKMGRRARVLVQLVGDAEIRDYMQAAWQTISPGNLEQCACWITVGHVRGP